jgi:hypothetical protein
MREVPPGTEIGIVKSHKIGKEVVFLNVKLYDLLSRYHVGNIDTKTKCVAIFGAGNVDGEEVR